MTLNRARLHHTKIVATVGPASRAPERLRTLMEAGVDIFRLNFSHGTHEEHSVTLADIRAESAKAGRHVAVLQDLCGPKIRLGPIPGDAVECTLDEEFRLVHARSSEDDPRELTCSYEELLDDIRPGERILFADGTVAMDVVEVGPGFARLKVTLPGRLRSRQGINLPGTELRVDALTPKDIEDLDWTARHAADIDYIGLSFVRAASDIDRLRRELHARNIDAKIVAKIEKPQAVRNLEAIVAETDAVMVARGDLGVELDIAQVPAIQKRIIALCNKAVIPVITATQMLNSMENSSSPTRAEAADVFNAVLDGTDAVMLSGETAIGQYPVQAVRTMARICAEAEKALGEGEISMRPLPRLTVSHVSPLTEAIVDGALTVAHKLGLALVLVATASGRTALTLSQRRPSAAIFAFAEDERIARRMALYWGVEAFVTPTVRDLSAVTALGLPWAKERGLVQAGDRVAVIQGYGADTTLHHAIQVVEVP